MRKHEEESSRPHGAAVVASFPHNQAHAVSELEMLITTKSKSAAPPGQVRRAALVARSEGRPLLTEGVSVVICCHNGALRLPVTLAHLKAQESRNVEWEVLLVDNASTDDGVQVALECWNEGPAPLRVIHEPRLGVGYARERGFAEAKYEFVAFVDDDNWVASDWVATAFQTLAGEAGLGAVGSIRDPAFEVPAPEWFEKFHSSYAILTERDLREARQPANYLPTAGLCVRKTAWTRLVRQGFRFQLRGRSGRRLWGGEDTELTLALGLNGWCLRTEPRLRLQHFMPAHRLSWSYLRRLQRGDGASWVMLDAYTEYNLFSSRGLRFWLGQLWWSQLGKSLLELARRPRATVAALFSPAEGQYEVIEVERLFGRTQGLLRFRGRYGARRREVRSALWRRPNENGKPPEDSGRSLV
jgi:glycosyltransferase involved in cell wall biosynthesis